MSIRELITVLPEAILTLSATVVMLLAAFLRKRQEVWCAGVALVGLAAALISLFWQLPAGAASFNEMVRVDTFSVFFHALFIVTAVLVVLSSASYLKRERLPVGEFYALLLFATAGMGLMASANDLVLGFIGLEISSLSSYVLAGFRRNAAASSESALKYFLLGSFATAFLLYGIALMYGAMGTTRLTAIQAIMRGGLNPITAQNLAGEALAGAAVVEPVAAQLGRSVPAALLALSIGLIFVGLAFKISAAPFQVWTPDVYQGAPTPVTAFLSTGAKAAAFALFLRIFFVSLDSTIYPWPALLWVSAVLSMFVGNLAALWQTNLKRLLAYSSIAHAGYMLVAFAANSAEGASAVMFYLAAYTVMNLGAFVVVAHLGNHSERYVEIGDYAGLGFRSPLLAGCLSIFLLSLIGIPLTAGFLGKFYAFRAAVQADLIGLVVLGVLNSAVASYYYLRILVAMYMSTPEREIPIEPVPRPVAWVLALCAAGTIVLGVFPQPVLNFAARAAMAILPG
jgi:NADH-quinone oxidoreductase subunit N